MRTLSLLILAAAAAWGQTAPDILKKTAETYQSLKSYHFEARVVNESISDANESRTRTTRIAAAILPDRRRVESQGGQMAALRVFDGKTVWDYRPGVKQFARQEQAGYQPPRMNTLSDPVENYKALDKIEGAKLLREESVESNGAQRPCWVVEAPSRMKPGGAVLERSPDTFWIDKATNIVLKQAESMKVKFPMMDAPQTQNTTTTYVIARINQGAPEELFRFQPPADASEVGEFTSPFGGGTSIAGRPAPEISIEDLAGQNVTIASLRGKPVLVNFWATWCGPCREQMPRIQEAQRAFADKGLVVLAINQGETPEVARKYIEEHKYTFRVLLDRDKTVSNRYTVSGIPALFLIDAEGKIRAHFTGYNTALDLPAELKKLGLEK